MNKNKGIIAAAAAAILFGLSHVPAKLSYILGSNAAMLTLMRGVFALPLLFIFLKIKKTPLGLTKQEIRTVIVTGLFAYAPTGLLLYGSYKYIPIGMGIMLHYLFPVVVLAAQLLFFRKHITASKWAALALAMSGIALFTDKIEWGGWIGAIMAITSAFTYAAYCLAVERSVLSRMDPVKLSFYMVICGLAVLTPYTFATRQFVPNLSPGAWLCTFLVSMLVPVVGFTLFQIGIKYSNAETSSILATLEPILGLFSSVIFFQEDLSLPKLLGSAAVIAAMLVLSLGGAASQRREAAAARVSTR